MAASGGERAIDVRGLPPCEPMERILAACDALQPGQRLRALLSREPLPLFPILDSLPLRSVPANITIKGQG